MLALTLKCGPALCAALGVNAFINKIYLAWLEFTILSISLTVAIIVYDYVEERYSLSFN